ncbi:hypothetical protein A4X13_0g7675 [Tilletia indica]|uniref:Uncharacterized protein n=1 Tax=Tilletia indica TaxID=43049 RepID=A0A177T480_9BASI|nr:hypothetical protein A4X13_0g7675 [Tilletia indica]
MATRRTRTPTHPGTSRTAAIVVESSQSQESETSDSSTTSSHLADTQGTDENYDPDAGTQPIGSEGPGVAEELADLCNDPHSTDTDMLQREHEASTNTTVPSLGDAFIPNPQSKVASATENDTTLVDDDQNMAEEDEEDHGGDENDATADDSFSSAGTDAPSRRLSNLSLSQKPTPADLSSLRNFDPEDPYHHCKLIADTEKHGKKKGFRKGIKIHILPTTGRTKTVEIIWNDCEDFKLAKRLNFRIYWKGAPYVAKSWGPALPPRARVVKVHLPPVEDSTDLVAIFRQSCHQDARITHLWSLATTTSDPTAKPRPTGIIVAVVELVDHGGDPTRPISWKDHINLPRWIFFGGMWYETSYAGRFLACRDCRGRATYIHAKEDCPMPWCKPCRKNHCCKLLGSPGYSPVWLAIAAGPANSTSSSSSAVRD